MSSVFIAATAIVVTLVVATVIGLALTRRSGVFREADPESPQDNSDLGLSEIGPTVVHFSADWCGPCTSVRRVVDEVCADLAAVAHVEIDIEANPAAAGRLSVLSLPTTFIFDSDGRQRFRSAGVLKAADLRNTLQGLLA